VDVNAVGGSADAPIAEEKVDIAFPTKLVDAYPAVPNPATVEIRFGVERNPAVWNWNWSPAVVDTKEAVEI
jgi:hypothetical protein